MRVGGFDILDQLQATAALEGNIHNQNVRPDGGNGLERFRWFFAFAADHEVRLLVDELDEPLPNDGMVIHN